MLKDVSSHTRLASRCLRLHCGLSASLCSQDQSSQVTSSTMPSCFPACAQARNAQLCRCLEQPLYMSSLRNCTFSSSKNEKNPLIFVQMRQGWQATAGHTNHLHTRKILRFHGNCFAIVPTNLPLPVHGMRVHGSFTKSGLCPRR